MSLPYTSVLTALLALVGVVGLVVLAGRLARATGLARVQGGTRLIVRETMAIDRTRSLRIVSCDGREFLMLVGGGSDAMLGWLPSQDSPQ